MKKHFLWLLMAALLLLGAATSAFTQRKTEITVWCMAFDSRVNGFTNVMGENGGGERDGDHVQSRVAA